MILVSKFFTFLLKSALNSLCHSVEDFGLDVLEGHIKNSNFPWLISNVFDAETKKPLGNVAEKHIIEINDLKV